MPDQVTLQIHGCDGWQDAATIALADPASGHRGTTVFRYLDEYVFDTDGQPRGSTAASVRLPPSLDAHRYDGWPPFLLDLLPQGAVRAAVTSALGTPDQGTASDLAVLVRAGGCPVGNLRLKEAHTEERSRIVGIGTVPGFDGGEVFHRPDRLLSIAAEASGALGLQGAWPKLMLTRDRRDGLWNPEPLVADEDADRHAILKWAADSRSETALILAAEAPYLELARAFGLRCGQPLRHRDGALIMPRFDRRAIGGHVIRLGQESLVGALGVAAFGHEARHEDYLVVLREVCDDPAAEVTEYVLRDVLNLALGNPDNHGRNTALAKDIDGSVQLTPLFDFCPMRLDASGVRRSTTWGCMREPLGPSRDMDPDWSVVCDVAATGIMDPAQLKAVLASKAGLVEAMPRLASEIGVDGEVVRRAMGACGGLAASLRML